MSKLAISIVGEPGTTLKHTCGDVAETLADVTGWVFSEDRTFLSAKQRRAVSHCLITLEDYDIRYAWGVSPVQGGVGHNLFVGQSYVLTNMKQIRGFSFINLTNGENGVLMITPFWSTYS